MQRVDAKSYLFFYVQWGKKIIWSTADFLCLPTDKEMIGLFFLEF